MNTHNFNHHKSEFPVYKFCVFKRPHSVNSPNAAYKRAYQAEVKKQAKIEMDKFKEKSVITTPDIEVDIHWSFSMSKGLPADVDSIIKPTIDALKGTIYRDDIQVRRVSANRFDKNTRINVSGRVEDASKIIFTNNENAILVFIYSDSRLSENGGEDYIDNQRRAEYLSTLPKFRTH